MSMHPDRAGGLAWDVLSLMDLSFARAALLVTEYDASAVTVEDAGARGLIVFTSVFARLS